MTTLTSVLPDPIEAMLGQTALRTTLFAPTSRYYGIETAAIEQDGGPVVYLRRRFVPPADRFQLIQEHAVRQGERLDNIAAQHLGDPTLFWRLCDANRATRPEALTEEPGRRLRITLPEGIAGAPL
jgi:hypothetical protein